MSKSQNSAYDGFLLFTLYTYMRSANEKQKQKIIRYGKK